MKQSSLLVSETNVYEMAQFQINKHTLYLQVFDLQCVHVQAYDLTGGSEAVVRVNEMAEFGLGEELLLC